MWFAAIWSGLLLSVAGWQLSISLTPSVSDSLTYQLSDRGVNSSVVLTSSDLASTPLPLTAQPTVTPLLSQLGANVADFYMLGGGVYQWKPSSTSPTLSYLFGEQTPPFSSGYFFSCSGVVSISRRPFTCVELNATGSASGDIINVSTVTDSNPSSLPPTPYAGVYSVSVEITESRNRTTTENDFIRTALGVLLASRLTSNAILQTDSLQVLTLNEARLRKAQTANLFIYFMIAVLAFFSSCLLGLLLSWLWAPCSCIKKPPPFGVSWSTICWASILNFILFLLVGLEGALGGLIVLVAYWVILLGMGIYSEIMFKRQLKKAIEKGFADDGKVSNIELESANPRAGRVHVPHMREEDLPKYLQPRLTRVIVGVFFLVATVVILIIVIIFFGYTADDLRLWSRIEENSIIEFIPQITAKGILLMYAWPEFATNLKLAVFNRVATTECGNQFAVPLTDAEKDVQINEDFIVKYSIDMTIFTPSDYKAFNTVNEWFIRGLAPGARPIAPGTNVISSPADARTLAFDSVGDSRVWIKGGLFTIAELMDDVAGGSLEGLSGPFQEGHMLISRLAPQDYHRFHMPLDGTLMHITEVMGTFWSVGKDAATSGNYAFYNQRMVMIFSHPTIGSWVYIAIGATCVGSVNVERRFVNGTILPYKVGDILQRGDELGNMQFGGSTVITLLPKGSILWDDDLRYAASFPVESYLHMGQHVGVFPPDGRNSPIPPNDRVVNVGLGSEPIAGMTIGALLGIMVAGLIFGCVVKRCARNDIDVPKPDG